jgi:glycerol-3-phosphate dehydrogenase
MLPIMLPVYKYWQVPYYLAGCKLYDILAGKENMETSYVMSKGKALETFPMLKSDGLVGAVVYYDGVSFSSPLVDCYVDCAQDSIMIRE